MKGYKVFDSDWKCRGFQYAVGETFEEDVTPSCCNRGMHFCTNLADCFSCYHFNPENKVAEVIALGDTDADGNKTCTNKLQIIREVSWEEVLRLVNTGKANAGLCNSGNRNSGNHNSGDWNSGNHNSGDFNSGNRNSGNRNSGDWNSGNRNSGDCNSGSSNSGDWNSGDWNSGSHNSGNRNSGSHNSGDWNKTNYSSGCFNTEEANIMLFNKPSNWTYQDWYNSDARRLLSGIPKRCTEWIYAKNMTEQEKLDNPTYKVTGGYLKILDESEEAQKWWDNLSDYNQKIIKAIPNFDPDIFEQCTGIKIGNKNI